MNFCSLRFYTRPRGGPSGGLLPRFALAVALLLLLAAPAHARDFGLPVDKAAHFGLSYVMTDQLIRAGMKPVDASATVLALGLLKELLDERVEIGDLAADAAGVTLAAWRWEFRF